MYVNSPRIMVIELPRYLILRQNDVFFFTEYIETEKLSFGAKSVILVSVCTVTLNDYPFGSMTSQIFCEKYVLVVLNFLNILKNKKKRFYPRILNQNHLPRVPCKYLYSLPLYEVKWVLFK